MTKTLRIVAIKTIENCNVTDRELFNARAVCIFGGDSPETVRANSVATLQIGEQRLPVKIWAKGSKKGEIRVFSSLLKDLGLETGTEVTVKIEPATLEEMADWIEDTQNVEAQVMINYLKDVEQRAVGINEKTEQALEQVLSVHSEIKTLRKEAKRDKWIGVSVGMFGGLFGLALTLGTWVFDFTTAQDLVSKALSVSERSAVKP